MVLFASIAALQLTVSPADDTVAAFAARTWRVDRDEVRVNWLDPHPVERPVVGLKWLNDDVVVVRFAGNPGAVSRARIQSRQIVWVATQELPRKTILDSTTIKLTQEFVNGPPRQGLPVLGLVTQRHIRTGEIIAPPAVALPIAVSSGQTVRAVIRNSSFTLEVPARATASGAIGSRIGVLLNTGVRVKGTVLRSGVVQISDEKSDK
jgi:flagella basal body P-ring formation protein FlgA